MSRQGATGADAVLSALPPGAGDEKMHALLGAVRELADQDLTWLSGFAAGVVAGRQGGAAQRAQAALAPVAPPAVLSAVAPSAQAALAPVTVLYGTQSGNSKKLAERLSERLTAAGSAVRLVRLSDYSVRELAKERLVVLVIATYGDGDPADDSRAFYDFVLGKRAPRLPELRYAVLGLGDTSYPKFCYVARKLDDRLAELGAQRLVPRGECDVTFEPVAGPWLEAAAEKLLPVASAPASGVVIPLHTAAPAAPASNAATRQAPATATVLVQQQLTSRHAGKRVLHLELALEAEKLGYQTGDALAVWPQSSPELVAEVCGTLGLSSDELVTHDGRELPLGQWLAGERELTRLSRPVVAAIAERAAAPELARLLEPGDANQAALGELLATHQVIDLLLRAPGKWSAAELVAALRPLAPRSYSISSSALAYPDEAHLTVAEVAYAAANGRRRAGCASGYLARAQVDDLLRVFIEPNPGFRLPAPDADLIMIGPGTGVAPFRAFVQERELTGARGKNWLFFGEQRRRDTFLYQLEWLAALRKGSLHRLDVAFSRDQASKVYVQHRLLERGRDLWAALTGGAHLYVCGDAKRMAPDVEAALLAIARAHGGHDEDGALDWLAELRAQHRYHRDVY